MKKEDTAFDFKKAIQAIQEEQPLLGAEGILNPLVKQLTEAACVDALRTIRWPEGFQLSSI